jgi:hypothetical protein
MRAKGRCVNVDGVPSRRLNDLWLQENQEREYSKKYTEKKYPCTGGYLLGCLLL